MVRFDSQTGHLILQKAASVAGEGVKTDPLPLPLGQVDERTRQVAIAVAKLVTTYANGGRLDRPRQVVTPDGRREAPSLVEEFNTLVDRLFPTSPARDESAVSGKSAAMEEA